MPLSMLDKLAANLQPGRRPGGSVLHHCEADIAACSEADLDNCLRDGGIKYRAGTYAILGASEVDH